MSSTLVIRYHCVVPILLALASAAVYGVADYCGGRASRSAPALFVTFIGQLSSAILAFAIVLIVGTPFPPAADIWWGALTGCASAFSLLCFYSALSRGAMTVVAPITAVTSAVIPVAVGLLQGERPSGIAYLGMALAVVAVALVSGAIGERHGHATSSTIALALLAGVGFAMIFITLDQTSSASGVWPLVAARVVSVTLMIFIIGASDTSLRGHGAIWKLAAFTGVLDMTANLFYLLAVRRGLLSVVVVVAALYPVSTVALAFVLDRERISRSQAVGMALALGALILVSASGSA